MCSKSSFVIPEDNVQKIIRYLQPAHADSDLVASLIKSLDNSPPPATSGLSNAHRSFLSECIFKFESGEHDDDEISLTFPKNNSEKDHTPTSSNHQDQLGPLDLASGLYPSLIDVLPKNNSEKDYTSGSPTPPTSFIQAQPGSVELVNTVAGLVGLLSPISTGISLLSHIALNPGNRVRARLPAVAMSPERYFSGKAGTTKYAVAGKAGIVKTGIVKAGIVKAGIGKAGIGKGVSLFESHEHDETTEEKQLLRLPNGIALSYGQIIALAGDFYGIAETPICLPDHGGSWETRFMNAYGTLAEGNRTEIQKELDQILEIMKIEKNSVDTVLGRGDPAIPTVLDKDITYTAPSDVYKHHGLWFTIQYDTILGGSWLGGFPMKQGRMMKLAANNPDHFQPYSRAVWKAGHDRALIAARQASEVYGEGRVEEGIALLEQAYSISAFSCHFLTDSFSAGHIRVPRQELPACVTPTWVGHLLVHKHHDEDGRFGINVINPLNQRWRCFGDGTLFDDKSQDNKRRVRQVVRDCIAQVWGAFESGSARGDADAILNQLPFVDERSPNNFPLFRVSCDGRVLRRKDVEDLGDSRTIGNWWGSTTLTLLESYNPKNSVV